jgi:hypothetical protein
MLTLAATKLRKSISVKPQHSDGSDGETTSCKANGPRQGMLSNWRLVMHSCEL